MLAARFITGVLINFECSGHLDPFEVVKSALYVIWKNSPL